MTRIYCLTLLFGLLFCLLLTPTAPLRADWQAGFFLDADHVLHDQGGRRLTLRQPFARIISLYGAHTENLLDLGLDEEIIGVCKADRALGRVVADKPVFSYHDGPEKFLAARPDLVLIRPMIDRGYARLVAQLEKNGITVVSIQPGSVAEMYRYWAILGELTGRQQSDQEMIGRFQKAVAEFSAISQAVASPKRVYFEAIHLHMKTFSPGSMADFVLTTAGGINIADDAAPSRGTNIAVYGKEHILSKADQIDVYLAQAGPMNRPTRALIKNEPGFSVIKAIQNNAVYIIDEQIVSRPTMRLLLGIHQIGRLLYPDLYGTEWDQIKIKGQGRNFVGSRASIKNEGNKK